LSIPTVRLRINLIWENTNRISTQHFANRNESGQAQRVCVACAAAVLHMTAACLS
jgi:hypothetical protein